MEHKKTEYSLVKVLIGTVVGITGLIYLGLLTVFSRLAALARI